MTATPWKLVRPETRVQTTIFFRTPIAAFFTLAFPLFFLVLINLLNSGVTVDSLGGIPLSQFVTPGIAVFAMVTATFTNLAINTAAARDSGVLKRVLSTPVPMSVHLAGRLCSAALIGVVSVVLMLAIGALLFGVEIPWSDSALILLLMALGAATFSALGLGVAAVSPNSRSAPALANAFILPLAFISGIFYPLEEAPEWLRTVAGLFPLEPFATAVTEIFNPTMEPDFPWRAVLTMSVWMAAGVLVAVRFFSWEPRPGGSLRKSE
ncbi:MAG TPA: ABC transporter permease [Acidimicrobiia bacterium]|nr:ABC transporter permease [Acidimicrobiia bacterium]